MTYHDLDDLAAQRRALLELADSFTDAERQAAGPVLADLADALADGLSAEQHRQRLGEVTDRLIVANRTGVYLPINDPDTTSTEGTP